MPTVTVDGIEIEVPQGATVQIRLGPAPSWRLERHQRKFAEAAQ